MTNIYNSEKSTKSSNKQCSSKISIILNVLLRVFFYANLSQGNILYWPKFYRLTSVCISKRLKTNFSYIKTYLFDFFFFESQDTASSSKQPEYVILEYCFILIPLYIILRFPAFFNLSFTPKSMHFVLT